MSRDDPILIVQLNIPSDESQGDYFYRSFAPGRAMARLSGVYVINLTNEHRHRLAVIEPADVLIINMVCDLELYPIIERRRKAGLVTVYELNDDVFNLPVWNPAHAFYEVSFNRKVLQLLMRASDAVQFSSRMLKEKYSRSSECSVVFSNQIPFIPVLRRWDRDKTLVLGWGGSNGHLEDMASISEHLSRWCSRHENVRFHLMGARRIWDLFEGIPEHRKSYFPPGSILDYYQFLSTLDIGIAPLLPSEYNLCRSDVKFLEYASHGVVPVLQRIPPYVETVESGITGLLFSNAEELLGHLGRLREDFRYRVRLATAARDFVCSHRTYARDSLRRLSFYRWLLGRVSSRSKQGSERVHREFERWSSVDGAIRYGRFLILTPTRFELELRMRMDPLSRLSGL